MQETVKLLVEFVKSSYFLQQVAPLAVLLIVPAFALFARAHWHALSWLFRMLLEGWGISFPWNWGNGERAMNEGVERRKAKKKSTVRTRAEQLEMNGSAIHADESSEKDEEDEDDVYYPGLVNISGTYCFLNSVLQAMSSLSYLQPHIEAIHAKAVELDVPTPVVDALRDTLTALNTPKSVPSALRPIPMINALSQPIPGKKSKLFSSREHQDAQELFQLLSECVKNESLAIDNEGQRDRGLGGLVKDGAEVGPGVFDGLTANRRSCVECGYTEAVMHFAFDNWQLSLPRMTAACTLEDCLADYIRLELLTDCICRKCSMLATHQRLLQEAEKLTEGVSGDSTVSQSKKKRARDARKLEAKVKAAIEEGRIEEDIKGVKMEKIFSKASTKQAMIARPPRVLVLHLNRSVHYGNYAGRNSCRVIFPEVLDLTPYTTSGQLSTLPSSPLSMPPPPIPRSTTPTQSIYSTPRVLYRLSAVVAHYGAHSFGHYVCFRRKPRPSPSASSPLASFSPPKMACPYGCECAGCQTHGPVRDERMPAPGRGWLRISDASVEECGSERVLAEGVGAFMLFYERVVPITPPPRTAASIYLSHSPRSSEETVRPEPDADVSMNGSTWSMSSLSGSGSLLSEDDGERTLIRPRVVRRTTAGRSRGTSLAPDRAASEVPSVVEEEVPAGPSNSAQTPKSVQNGHANPLSEDAELPSTETQVDTTKNDTIRGHKNRTQTPLSNPSPRPPAAHSSPKPVSQPRPPSPTPSTKASQARIKAPQPIRAHVSSGIPDRAPMGLRA